MLFFLLYSRYYMLQNILYKNTINIWPLIKGGIKVNNLFGKEIKMTEINQIEKYAGTYIVKTDKKKLSIDTHIIDKESLIALNAALENLNVAWV